MEKHHDDIVEVCQKAGFKDIIPVGPGLAMEIYLKALCENTKDINIGGSLSYITCGHFKFMNIVKHMPECYGAFLFELCDIIAPYAYDCKQINHDEGPYEWNDVKLLPGDVVLDCGANFGLFAVLAASRGCRCYAFEPIPELHSIMSYNQELNGVSFIPVDAAISN